MLVGADPGNLPQASSGWDSILGADLKRRQERRDRMGVEEREEVILCVNRHERRWTL